MIARSSLLFSLFTGTALSLVLPTLAAAETCDLREGQSTSCSITGTGSGGGSVLGWFYVDEQHPTGTGVIDPFLRLQQQGSRDWEQGYNTTARSYPLPAPGPKTQFDEKSDPNYTRNLLLSEVEITTRPGGGATQYRQFLLDLNEPNSAVGSKYLITLDQLEIYVSNDPNLDKYAAASANGTGGALGYTGGGGSAVKIFDLDESGGSGDNYVQLDYRVSGEGSGSSDMAFYLDNSLFGSYTYVYLFSQFGNIDGNSKKYGTDGGFEEWFTLKGTLPPPSTAVPEPASMLLVGTGLLAAARRRFRRA